MHPLLEEWDTGLASTDPLEFPGYADRLAGLDGESVVTGVTEHYVLIESRFDVFGGSMGVVAGEKVCRAFDRATDAGLPVVCVTRSGGARMQEGMISLVQLGRTAAAVERHAAAGLLSVAVHWSPTTGGVLASYGSLCDVRAVEDGAVIGFAGPMVVEQTTGEVVAGRSHDASTALAAGLVDAIVPTDGGAQWLEGVLGLRDVAPPLRELPRPAPADSGAGAGAWGEVLRARRADRPSGVDVAARLASSWTPLADPDPTVVTALATIAGQRVVVIASDRHRGTGRPTPAGFRQARRAIALAGRLGLPLVSFVDTPGADPGSASENDGIAGEIARTFADMATLPTASVAVCVGEGGSGGALALAWCDRLLIQEHAVFSVIGPEGAASILRKDASQAQEVAPSLHLTSADLADLGIVDAVVGEHADDVAKAVAVALDEALPGDRHRRADTVSAAALTGG